MRIQVGVVWFGDGWARYVLLTGVGENVAKIPLPVSVSTYLPICARDQPPSIPAWPYQHPAFPPNLSHSVLEKLALDSLLSEPSPKICTSPEILIS